MNVDELKKRKKEMGYTFERLSEVSGVSVAGLKKIFGGETKNPRVETLNAIMYSLDHVAEFPRVAEPAYFQYNATAEKIIEHNLNDKYQFDLPSRHINGEYTIDDYYLFPNDVRCEIIDGYYIEMNAPTLKHNDIAGEIYLRIKMHIKEKGGACWAGIAPVDVQLSVDDNKTIVQPDVLIVCDRDKLTEKRVIGAPDFVVEIESPSTGYIDSHIKMVKYKEAGVREYWTVHDDGRVVRYLFDKEGSISLYRNTDCVPVGIFDDEFVIDFGEIMESILE